MTSYNNNLKPYKVISDINFNQASNNEKLHHTSPLLLNEKTKHSNMNQNYQQFDYNTGDPKHTNFGSANNFQYYNNTHLNSVHNQGINNSDLKPKNMEHRVENHIKNYTEKIYNDKELGLSENQLEIYLCPFLSKKILIKLNFF